MNTEIIEIQDKSGSMGALRAAVIAAYNAFLTEQRAVPGAARVTCVQFNGEVKRLYEAVPLSEVPAMTEADYIPMGSTALLDAIGTTLEEQGKRIAAEGWAELVIVHISTDGEENVSCKFSLEQVKEMIAHAQDKAGWVFLFQAANQDAFAAGGKYGISAATTSSFTASAAGMQDSYAATSMSVTRMRTAGAQPQGETWADAIANVQVPQPQPSGVLPDATGTKP